MISLSTRLHFQKQYKTNKIFDKRSDLQPQSLDQNRCYQNSSKPLMNKFRNPKMISQKAIKSKPPKGSIDRVASRHSRLCLFERQQPTSAVTSKLCSASFKVQCSLSNSSLHSRSPVRSCTTDYNNTTIPERLRSDDYVRRIINSKNTRKDIADLPWYSTPEKRDIGSGHLACIKYAGGRPQPRRRPYYTVGDLVPGDVKSDVNLMSFYSKNRKAAEDASPSIPVERHVEIVSEDRPVRKEPDEDTIKKVQEYLDKKAAEKKLYNEAVLQAIADEQERQAKEREEEKKKQEEDEDKTANLVLSSSSGVVNADVVSDDVQEVERSVVENVDQDVEDQPYEVDQDEETQIEENVPQEEEEEKQEQVEEVEIDAGAATAEPESEQASEPQVAELVSDVADAPKVHESHDSAGGAQGFDWSQYDSEPEEAIAEAPAHEEITTDGEVESQQFDDVDNASARDDGEEADLAHSDVNEEAPEVTEAKAESEQHEDERSEDEEDDDDHTVTICEIVDDEETDAPVVQEIQDEEEQVESEHEQVSEDEEAKSVHETTDEE
ncbi:unnamed protein product [Trichogramma brassicae]|uniref:Uncharacterized protein n=1 Tax=Trichogramma brassicae TaxID=86971 RepID=A0A6H5IZJ3_9HYME|nr:unnamed protein product [Trichogramma brassicae]